MWIHFRLQCKVIRNVPSTWSISIFYCLLRYSIPVAFLEKWYFSCYFSHLLQTPINDPPLEVIRSPHNVCMGENQNDLQDLIVLIKSCSTCFDDRTNARKSYMRPSLWQNIRIQFVFVTGLPSDDRQDNYNFYGVWIKPYLGKRPKGMTTLEAKKRLLNESDFYQDLLIGNFDDTYYNLTTKMMLTFRWIAAFCKYQSPVYMFMDNDHSLVPSSTTSLIRKIPLAVKPSFNAGTRMLNQVVLHSSNSSYLDDKWSVSPNEIPWTKYPSYALGSSYIVGSQLVSDAAIAMAFTRNFRIDDVYLGFVWAKLGSHVYALRQMQYDINELTNPDDVITALSVHVDKAMNWTTGVMNMSKLKPH